MTKRKKCVDCPSSSRSVAKYPGPRCATHHRARRKATSERQWAQRIEQTYGLTAEQYWQIYESQGGKCYMCQRATGRTRRLAVDHDHATGYVRGLLCKRDNTLLGHARDNPEYFNRAISYLDSPPAQRMGIWAKP